MKLSEKEKRLLSAVEFSAKSTPKTLQKETGYTEHTIRYGLIKLEERGLLSSPRPIIDWNVLGFIHYTLLFSLPPKNSTSRDTLLAFLTSSKEVSWVFEVGGDFNYGISLCVPSFQSAAHFLHTLAGQFDAVVIGKSFATQISFYYFGRRYFGPKGKKRAPEIFNLTKDAEELDPVDWKVVGGLTKNAYRSVKDLAGQLSLPMATVDRRIKKLEKRGIIRGYFHWIDASLLGLQRYILFLEVKGLSQHFMEELVRFAESEMHVTYLTECIGQWDFEIGIEIERQAAVTEIGQKLSRSLGKWIKTLHIVPVLSYRKFRGTKSE